MRTEYTEQLLARAQRDDEFRARLITDPKAAISEELGVEIPDELNIRVIEEEGDEVVLVLPAKFEAREVRDEQLAGVAGGTGGSWCGTTQCPGECTEGFSF
jgi:hypothetical protein